MLSYFVLHTKHEFPRCWSGCDCSPKCELSTLGQKEGHHGRVTGCTGLATQVIMCASLASMMKSRLFAGYCNLQPQMTPIVSIMPKNQLPVNPKLNVCTYYRTSHLRYALAKQNHAACCIMHHEFPIRRMNSCNELDSQRKGYPGNPDQLIRQLHFPSPLLCVSSSATPFLSASLGEGKTKCKVSRPCFRAWGAVAAPLGFIGRFTNTYVSHPDPSIGRGFKGSKDPLS